MGDQFIKFGSSKKTQTQLLSELQRLLQKIYVRLPVNSEEQDFVVKAMDIVKDLR
nr:MAG: hypothetical protein [Microvirus sp.]